MILQIPPIAQQASLRTALLLRFTSETLASIPHYQPTLSVLPQLLNWLDQLDKGWLAVLRLQAWDTSLHEGIDAQIERLPDDTLMDDAIPNRVAVSQTDRARLRSILMSASSALEEWLDALNAVPTGSENTRDQPDVEQVLDRMNVSQSFNDLFSGTLGEMGELGGEVLNAGEEVEMT